MKVKDSIKPAIWFLLGSLVSYFLSQIRFFEIDREINVVETIISVISIFIGLFIAISLQKNLNRNQNSYNYLVAKLDRLWADFNSFSIQIEANDQIELARVNLFFKEMTIKSTDFNRLLTALDNKSNNIEPFMNELQELLENSLTRDNILYYHTSKKQILLKADEIGHAFIAVYKEINTRF